MWIKIFMMLMIFRNDTESERQTKNNILGFSGSLHSSSWRSKTHVADKTNSDANDYLRNHYKLVKSALSEIISILQDLLS
jgi:hypothetical protein